MRKSKTSPQVKFQQLRSPCKASVLSTVSKVPDKLASSKSVPNMQVHSGLCNLPGINSPGSWWQSNSLSEAQTRFCLWNSLASTETGTLVADVAKLRQINTCVRMCASSLSKNSSHGSHGYLSLVAEAQAQRLPHIRALADVDKLCTLQITKHVSREIICHSNFCHPHVVQFKVMTSSVKPLHVLARL